MSVAWRGPAYAEHGTWLRLKVLWKYLTDSAASPLQKEFVECEEPLCSDIGPCAASELSSPRPP